MTMWDYLYNPYKPREENEIPRGEWCCGNCSWWERNYCLNPKNATLGRAGSDYSSSELTKPIYVTKNKVCQRHEKFEEPIIKEIFPLFK